MNIAYALRPAAAQALAGLQWRASPVHRLARRFRAIARIVARRRRDRRRVEDLRHLDDRTLRDLGVTRSELASVVAELGGHAAATRRRTDLDVWPSASSRFRSQAMDAYL